MQNTNFYTVKQLYIRQFFVFLDQHRGGTSVTIAGP